MKKIAIRLTVFALLLSIFAGCRKDRNTADLSGQYTLVLGQEKEIPSTKKMASLTLLSSTDNRCPANANCISAGNAIVKVRFKDAQTDQTFDLCLGDCDDVTTTFSTKGIKYQITLKTLQPYPGSIALVALPTTAAIEITSTR